MRYGAPSGQAVRPERRRPTIWSCRGKRCARAGGSEIGRPGDFGRGREVRPFRAGFSKARRVEADPGDALQVFAFPQVVIPKVLAHSWAAGFKALRRRVESLDVAHMRLRKQRWNGGAVFVGTPDAPYVWLRDSFDADRHTRPASKDAMRACRALLNARCSMRSQAPDRTRNLVNPASGHKGILNVAPSRGRLHASFLL